MNQLFEIKFDFALDHSALTISLKATVEPHHSELYYVVDNFHFFSASPKKDDLSIFPSQEIKQITRGATKVWVHKDSERESLLSVAIGKAIEGVVNKS